MRSGSCGGSIGGIPVAYSILRGVGYTVATMPVGKAAAGFLRLYDLKVGPVPLLVLFLALLTLAGVFVLRRTAFGRYINAIGGNEQVARLSGIRVDRVKIGVYVLCGTLAALTKDCFTSPAPASAMPGNRRRRGASGDYGRDPRGDEPVWRPGWADRHARRRAAHRPDQ